MSVMNPQLIYDLPNGMEHDQAVELFGVGGMTDLFLVLAFTASKQPLPSQKTRFAPWQTRAELQPTFPSRRLLLTLLPSQPSLTVEAPRPRRRQLLGSSHGI
jgi:hypothetical protein